MDKLLCIRLDENGNDRHRRSFAYTTESNNPEVMESTVQAAMRIAETRHRKSPGKADILHERPLPMDRNKNLCSQGNLKREAETGGACKLL